MTVSKGLSEIVRVCFFKTALLDIFQLKYVSAEVYLEIMKMNYSNLDVIRNLTLKGFKKTVFNIPSHSTFVQDNITKFYIKEVKRLKII